MRCEYGTWILRQIPKFFFIARVHDGLTPLVPEWGRTRGFICTTDNENVTADIRAIFLDDRTADSSDIAGDSPLDDNIAADRQHAVGPRLNDHGFPVTHDFLIRSVVDDKGFRRNRNLRVREGRAHQDEEDRNGKDPQIKGMFSKRDRG